MINSNQTNLYEKDFNLWIEKTAQLLRDRDFNAVDWENVIEEIEGLTRSDRRALRSQTTRVMQHLLKWQFQPDRRSKSWQDSIDDGREQIGLILDDSPSLKLYIASNLMQWYPEAIRKAVKDTGYSNQEFPINCPYTIEQILNFNFLP